jgi:hypothetical protein
LFLLKIPLNISGAAIEPFLLSQARIHPATIGALEALLEFVD